MGTFYEIILDLENDLSRMKKVSEKLPDQMEYAIGHCKIALDRMRENQIKQGKPAQQKENFSKRSNQQFTADYYTSGLSLIWKVNAKKPTHL